MTSPTVRAAWRSLVLFQILTHFIFQGRSSYQGMADAVINYLRVDMMKASIHRQSRPLRCTDDAFAQTLVSFNPLCFAVYLRHRSFTPDRAS